ncbi:MAG: polymer-forming cytoskeletal protein, partial [Spirochaetaceae bacterium]|nr:polymer-forming cytoskeletal protein [Spirochaetaceae bacterium]
MKDMRRLAYATLPSLLGGFVLWGCLHAIAEVEHAGLVIGSEFVDVAALVAGGSIGNVRSSSSFSAGASSVVNGYVIAPGAVTVGASGLISGNIESGAAFSCGASTVVYGNVHAAGAITLGAGSRILGTVASGIGVVVFAAGSSVGSVIPWEKYSDINALAAGEISG